MKAIAAVCLLLALAACATPEPVLIRPELPPDLFVCTPPPPKPSSMTGADLANRSNAWAAAYDTCQCQLVLVRDLIDGRDVDAVEACRGDFLTSERALE